MANVLDFISYAALTILTVLALWGLFTTTNGTKNHDD